jgi:DNA-binding GntR family transcriptional regulator
VIKIVAARCTDFEPVYYGVSYLDNERVQRITTLLDNSSFYDLCRKNNLEKEKSTVTVEATIAGEQSASLLNVKNGAPLFLMKGSMRDPKNQVIEYFEVFTV